MTDLDERLRHELRVHAEAAHPSADLPSALGVAVSRRQRRRSRLVAATAVVLVAALVGAALLIRAGDEDSTRVVTGPNPPAGTPGAWTPMPDGPLSPRTDALAFTVGDEVLIFGGGPRCPSNARCGPQSWSGLTDGAAYKPSTGEWRRIADMPRPLDRASGTVVGDQLYLWGQLACPPRANCPSTYLNTFTSYDAGDDTWTDRVLPDGVLRTDEPPGLAADGAGILAFNPAGSVVNPDVFDAAAATSMPDFVFDPATDEWTTIPDDPLRPSADRAVVPHDGDLYVFSQSARPEDRAPGYVVAAYEAAVLRSGSDSWEPLPDSGVFGAKGFGWHLVGDDIVTPAPPLPADAPNGPSDDISWVSEGAILDTRSDTWVGLPQPQTGYPGLLGSAPLGTVAGDRLILALGFVFNLATDTWTPLPALPAAVGDDGVASAWVGDQLIVWGGADRAGTESSAGAIWTAAG